MISDYPNGRPPDPKDGTPAAKKFPSQGGVPLPRIQIQIEAWIIGLGLSRTAAKFLTEEFCEAVKKKAREEGQRKVRTSYEIGYENSYIEITTSRDRAHNPEEMLGKFLFERSIKGDWIISSKKKGVGTYIYRCLPKKNKKTKQTKEQAALKAVEKLNPNQVEALIAELQRMIDG